MNNTDWIYENPEADSNGNITVPKERYENMKNALFSVSILGYQGKANCYQCKEIDEAFVYAKSICRSGLGMKTNK